MGRRVVIAFLAIAIAVPIVSLETADPASAELQLGNPLTCADIFANDPTDTPKHQQEYEPPLTRVSSAVWKATAPVTATFVENDNYDFDSPHQTIDWGDGDQSTFSLSETCERPSPCESECQAICAFNTLVVETTPVTDDDCVFGVYGDSVATHTYTEPGDYAIAAPGHARILRVVPPEDLDFDGVPDDEDECEETPTSHLADDEGCILEPRINSTWDADSPNAIELTAVDENGDPLDDPRITQYRWDLNGDGSFDLSETTGSPLAITSFPEGGDHNVRMFLEGTSPYPPHHCCQPSEEAFRTVSVGFSRTASTSWDAEGTVGEVLYGRAHLGNSLEAGFDRSGRLRAKVQHSLGGGVGFGYVPTLDLWPKRTKFGNGAQIGIAGAGAELKTDLWGTSEVTTDVDGALPAAYVAYFLAHYLAVGPIAGGASAADLSLLTRRLAEAYAPSADLGAFDAVDTIGASARIKGTAGLAPTLRSVRLDEHGQVEATQGEINAGLGFETDAGLALEFGENQLDGSRWAELTVSFDVGVSSQLQALVDRVGGNLDLNGQVAACSTKLRAETSALGTPQRVVWSSAVSEGGCGLAGAIHEAQLTFADSSALRELESRVPVVHRMLKLASSGSPQSLPPWRPVIDAIDLFAAWPRADDVAREFDSVTLVDKASRSLAATFALGIPVQLKGIVPGTAQVGVSGGCAVGWDNRRFAVVEDPVSGDRVWEAYQTTAGSPTVSDDCWTDVTEAAFGEPGAGDDHSIEQDTRTVLKGRVVEVFEKNPTITVEFGENSLPDDTDMTFSGWWPGGIEAPTAPVPVDGLDVVGAVFGMSPDPPDLTLSEPVTVSIDYEDGFLGGVDPTGLALFRRDGDHWQPLVSTVDPGAHKVTAVSDRLGSFAIGRDVVAPVIQTANPSPGDVFGQPDVPIGFFVADGSAAPDALTIAATVDGEPVALTRAGDTMTALASGLVDGPHQLVINAADPAGNTSSASVDFTVASDAPSPPTNGAAEVGGGGFGWHLTWDAPPGITEFVVARKEAGQSGEPRPVAVAEGPEIVDTTQPAFAGVRYYVRSRSPGGALSEPLVIATSPLRADVRVAPSKSKSAVGNNVYNESGASQTVAKKVKRGKTAKYFFRIENDGGEGNGWFIGTGGSDCVTTRWFWGHEPDAFEATGEILAGYIAGYNPGASERLRLDVKVKRCALKGSKLFVNLDGAPTSAELGYDRARAKIVVK